MKDCICNECTVEFRAPRADSRYCSSACRQSAYRRRKSVTDRRMVTAWVAREVLVPWTLERDVERDRLLSAIAAARHRLEHGGDASTVEQLFDCVAAYLCGKGVMR